MPRGTIVCLAVLAAPAATVHAEPTAADPDPIEWGFGGKVRRSHASEQLQELFVGDSPGSATQDGAGVEFTRRTRQVEVVFGLGYDPLIGKDGYYLEKDGDPLAPGDVDYVEFDQLAWFTIEITAVGHLQIHKVLGLRYGAGLGVGIMHGEVRRTDALCTSDRLQQDCMIDPNGVQVDEPADLSPVYPVINVLAGVELRPFRWIAIYADVGLHTVPYVAAGVTLYPWR